MASKQFNSVDGYSIGNATVVVDANANVTAAALTANGNVSFTGPNISLGAVGNLKITGGSSGLYLQTDGTGNLSWQAVSVSAASISNGNSNVNIPAANGNIQVSVAGTANVITFTSNNAYRGAYGLTGFVYQANTAPASPQPGDQWYNTFNGILFEYLDDGTSAQWVDISTLPLPNIATVNAAAVLNNVQSIGTYFPAFISSTANANYALSSNSAFSANFANGAMIATTFVGALSGAATTAGTVTTAAQPNITSLGTLTSLGVNGNVTAANITANTGVFTGNGSGLSAIAGANVTGTVSAATTAGTVTTAAQPNITSVGTLTSLGVSGNITAANITANTGVFTGNGSGLSAIAGANVTGTVSSATTATTAGTVTTAAQPNITSVGTLTSLGVNGTVTAVAFTANTGVFTGNGSGLSAIAGANVSGTVSSATTAGTVTTAAQPNITSVGTLTSLNSSGTITAPAFTANTGVFTGNGSGLSAIAGANVTGTVASATAATTAGTVTTAAQPNITSVGTLSSLSVTGNVAAGNLTTTGVLSVTGTGVSSIAGNLDMTSNTIINLATPTNANDAATKQYVDDVAQGLHTHDTCNAATNTTLASISGGTVTYNNGSSGVGATLTTTGSYTTIDGVTLTNGMRILVKDEANSAHNGIYDRTSATVLTRSTDFDTPTEMAGGDFTFITAGTLYDNTGWVMTEPVTTVGTSPVPWVQFSGAGTYTAGTGLTLTGSQFSVNASQTQITSVGTLTGLNSSGTITAPAFTANTGVFTGNGSGLSAIAGANVTGTVSSATTATTAGTVTTAAQPNITSTGTLSSLTVSGNTFLATSSGNVGIGTNTPSARLQIVSAAPLRMGTASDNFLFGQINTNLWGWLSSSSVYALTFDGGTGNVGIGTGTSYPGARLDVLSTGETPAILRSTGVNTYLQFVNSANSAGYIGYSGSALTFWTGPERMRIASDGNVGIGTSSPGSRLDVNGTVNATLYAGSGANLTTLNASNISSGTLAQARLANASVTLGSTALTLGSTVTTVAGLSSVTSTTFVGSLSGAATTAGTVTTAAQPNITSVGTLSSVTVSGNSNLPVININRVNSGTTGINWYSTTYDTWQQYMAQAGQTGIGTRASLTVPSGTLVTSWGLRSYIEDAAGYGWTFESGTGPNDTTPTVVAEIRSSDGAARFGSVQTPTLTTGANTTAGTVTGNWTLTAGSRWQATYADLAEKYAADATYEPGTVLLFGGEQEVTLSNAFDSTKVAGVVTTNPAYSMNAALEAEHIAEIALQGRVPCKVIGPIEKGDLMVSASNGHAIANNEARAGTIIGKALENFTGEVGIIEVAVGRF